MQTTPYGAWQSPITADLIVAGSIGLAEPLLDDDQIYWLERRPQEQGRSVIVQYDPDGTMDITPPGFNVRNRVHEYGGASYTVVDGVVYFVNFTDQRIYRQVIGELPEPITGDLPRRYADLVVDQDRDRLIAVAEDHSGGGHEPENLIVAIDVTTGIETSLVTGNDFYTSPRLSPDGQSLVWISWDHPAMPWDQTQLWLGQFNEAGEIVQRTMIAGQTPEAIVEPRWSNAGELYFSSDRSGWWNLYHYHQGSITPLYPAEKEFGYPHWIFGEATYGFGSEQDLICTYCHQGAWHLAQLNLESHHLTPIATPYSAIMYLQVNEGMALFLAGSATTPSAIVAMDLYTQEIEVLKESSTVAIAPGYLSKPKAVTFPTTGGLTAHGWYYPPTNANYQGPPEELPPLVVKSHGGPTTMTTPSFNLKIQYYTSRGFGYLDVNYGGSTGYGRDYRQRLYGQWGVVDVDDCVHGAEYLAARGYVDRDRLAITGGSAGGYTTLAALTFKDTFKAGASHYGISDLEALLRDTHKFEARYLDTLIGPYPDCQDLYKERSPIHHTAQLSCPVIFFQGLEDQVVPPNQAEMMVAALQQKGLPVAYVPFPGEQHGFRIAANIKAAIEGEFYFYSRIFNFTPAEDLPAIAIMNLENQIN